MQSVSFRSRLGAAFIWSIVGVALNACSGETVASQNAESVEAFIQRVELELAEIGE